MQWSEEQTLAASVVLICGWPEHLQGIRKSRIYLQHGRVELTEGLSKLGDLFIRKCAVNHFDQNGPPVRRIFGRQAGRWTGVQSFWANAEDLRHRMPSFNFFSVQNTFSIRSIWLILWSLVTRPTRFVRTILFWLRNRALNIFRSFTAKIKFNLLHILAWMNEEDISN